MTPVEYAQAYLSNRRQDLVQRLNSVERSLRRETFAPSRDSEDRAAEFENDEVLDRLAEITRVELSRLDHAIRRLNAGHYGECERCGGAIGESRLRIVPEATQCTRCSQTHAPA